MTPPLPDDLWFPVAPGITQIPNRPAAVTAEPVAGNSIPTPEGFDAANPGDVWLSLPVDTPPIYEKTLTPTALIPVYQEAVKAVGVVRLRLLATRYAYNLSVADRIASLPITLGLSAARVKLIGCAEATYTLSGKTAAFAFTKRVQAAAGSFVSTGYSAGSVRSYGIGTNAGTFALSGQNAIVAYQRSQFAAAAGSYSLGGESVGWRKGIIMSAAAGSFSLGGQAAYSIRSYRLVGAASSCVATGQVAQLNKTVPVVLLLHMNGANNSTTFADNSTYGRTITPAGTTSAYITTTQSKFGGASGYFVNAPYLTIADASELAFGASDFTIECWVRLVQTVGDAFKMIACQAASGSSNFAWALWYDVSSPTNIAFSYSSNGTTRTTITGSTTLSTSVWYHVAVVRSGADLKMYVNGTQRNNTYNIGTASIYDSTANLVVGAGYASSPGNFWYGYLDEMRISKVAQYTANFTAPAAEFPNP